MKTLMSLTLILGFTSLFARPVLLKRTYKLSLKLCQQTSKVVTHKEVQLNFVCLIGKAKKPLYRWKLAKKPIHYPLIINKQTPQGTPHLVIELNKVYLKVQYSPSGLQKQNALKKIFPKESTNELWTYLQATPYSEKKTLAYQ